MRYLLILLFIDSTAWSDAAPVGSMNECFERAQEVLSKPSPRPDTPLAGLICMGHEDLYVMHIDTGKWERHVRQRPPDPGA